MNWGQLADVIRGVAWKRLSSHEVDPSVSNGHEFQGVARLRDVLGAEPRRFETTYLLLDDEQEKKEVVHSWAKWYDARTGQPKRSPEWRLYYPQDAGVIQARMNAGDLLVIAATADGKLVVLLAPAGSTSEAELAALFELELSPDDELHARVIEKDESIGFVAASLLEELGIHRPAAPATGDGARVQVLAQRMITEHPEGLPAGIMVSALVRSEFTDVSAVDDPDGTLVRWIEAEAALFRAWEDQLIAQRVVLGFLLPDGLPDVAGFREFSMRIRQSRVSRAGGALQYHVAEILQAHRIRFDSQARIDDGEVPDFLFPGKREYEDDSFPSADLRMLAVKYTPKDRWRQVLAEAKRIWPKHLLTLEGSVSRRQLALMAASKLMLVVPRPLHPPEGDLLMSLADFLTDLPAAARLQ